MRSLLAVFVVLWIVLGVVAFRHLRHSQTPEVAPVVETESTAEANLKWLARHQSPDGRWSGTRFSERCAGARCTGVNPAEDDEELTGLALLGFLGAGYTPQNRASYV